MNERIFELAKLANIIQWDSLPSGAITPDHESVVKASKFAELIIQECADRLMQDDFKDFNSVMFLAGLRLKKHFGIKE